MHTFFIWAGQRLRLFFYAQIDTEIDTTALYVRISATPVRVRPPLPADKIPRRALYMAFCGAFIMSVGICLGTEFGTLRRLSARIPNACHRGRGGILSALRGESTNRLHEGRKRQGCSARGDSLRRNDGARGICKAVRFPVIPVWR